MITTLTGANSYLLHAELRRLVDEFVRKYSDLGLEKIDGEETEYDRIREALESLPFLASRKMVVLRAGSANKEFAENAEKLIGGLPETTDLIIIEPKLDKRSAYYKYLKKATNYQEYNELDDQGLARWLSGRAKEAGGNLSQSDALYLIGRVGLNQQLLANETDKLLLYDPQITRANIDLLTESSPQSTIFELLDAAFSGNAKKALNLYSEQRAQKTEPQQIIAMIGWQLYILAVIKAAGDRSPETIAKDAKLNPFVVRKSLGLTRQRSYADIKELVHSASELDISLKSQNIDADDALQNFLLNLGQ